MSEIKTIITEQLQQLQMLMHRTSFHTFMGNGRMHSPHRGQGRVLAILRMKPEISQRDLTYLLDMRKQSIAELLAKLEKKGYITREQSEDDKRVMMIKLTGEGRNAAEDVDDSVPEAASVLDCLDDEELRAFSGYLGRIIKRCQEQFPDEDFEQRHKAMEEFMMQHMRDHEFHGRAEAGEMGGYAGFPRGRGGEFFGRTGRRHGCHGRKED